MCINCCGSNCVLIYFKLGIVSWALVFCMAIIKLVQLIQPAHLTFFYINFLYFWICICILICFCIIIYFEQFCILSIRMMCYQSLNIHYHAPSFLSNLIYFVIHFQVFQVHFIHWVIPSSFLYSSLGFSCPQWLSIVSFPLSG